MENEIKLAIKRSQEITEKLEDEIVEVRRQVLELNEKLYNLRHEHTKELILRGGLYRQLEHLEDNSECICHRAEQRYCPTHCDGPDC